MNSDEGKENPVHNLDFEHDETGEDASPPDKTVTDEVETQLSRTTPIEVVAVAATESKQHDTVFNFCCVGMEHCVTPMSNIGNHKCSDCAGLVHAFCVGVRSDDNVYQCAKCNDMKYTCAIVPAPRISVSDNIMLEQHMKFYNKRQKYQVDKHDTYVQYVGGSSGSLEVNNKPVDKDRVNNKRKSPVGGSKEKKKKGKTALVRRRTTCSRGKVSKKK